MYRSEERSVNFRRICWISLLILLFVSCGTLNTVLTKVQDEVGFNRPLTQCLEMFLGMLVFCLTPHFIVEYLKKRQNEKKKKEREERKKKRKEMKEKTKPRTYLPDDDLLDPNQEEDVENELEDPFLNETSFSGLLDADDYDKDDNDSDDSSELENEDKLPPIDKRLFIIPAAFDLVASFSLYIGLIHTHASVYQMLRASVIVFAGIFASIFLKANVWRFIHNIGGMLLITLGCFIVAYSSILTGGGEDKPKNALFGACCIIFAQIVYATQFIVEEKVLRGYETSPLEVPGFEGLFGLSMGIFGIILLYFIPGSDHGSVENFPAAIGDVLNTPFLRNCILGVIVNIGIYNFAGNSITKELSANTRTLVDVFRNILVWLIQMIRQKEEFSSLQLLGFVILICGTFCYNKVGFSLICPGYEEKVNDWYRNRSRIEQVQEIGEDEDEDNVLRAEPEDSFFVEFNEDDFLDKKDD